MSKTAEIKKTVKVKELHLDAQKFENLKKFIHDEFIGRISSPIIEVLDRLSTAVEVEEK